MTPRGRLDVPWRHLLAGVAILAGRRPTAPEPAGIVGSSVRSLWGCLLDALELPPGSRVALTSPTVPGMVARIVERGLVPVPMALTRELRLPHDRLPEGVRAVLAAHLFGVRLDLDPVAAWCTERGIPLIEDMAQAWDGGEGHPGATATLFSFGMIKRCTALGGAVAQVRDQRLAEALAERAAALPRASRSRFAMRMLRATAIQALATPVGTTLLHGIARTAGRDVDDLVRRLVRAHAPDAEAAAVRLGPHPAERLFLAWRLARAAPHPEDHHARWQSLPAAWRVGRSDAMPSWTFPVQPPDPDGLVRALREAGHDASRRASGIIDLGSTIAGDLVASQLVYLPLTGDASFPWPLPADTVTPCPR